MVPVVGISARSEMIKYHTGAPMKRVQPNFQGPLRGLNEETNRSWSNSYQMGGMRPLPSQTTEVTATAAVNKYFVRFGCPFQIFTDQGRNFESKLFTAVCDLLEMHKVCTTPNRPSAN